MVLSSELIKWIGHLTVARGIERLMFRALALVRANMRDFGLCVKVKF